MDERRVSLNLSGDQVMSIEQVTMWVVYKHPKDFPNSYVARLWSGTTPTEEIIVGPDLNAVRGQLVDRHLVRLERNLDDDPVIVETWL